MSNNTDDRRSGFKNSRIDLSQLGDDTWNKPATRNPARPGPRRKQDASGPPSVGQRTHLDELFESRVRAAAARRSVKQSRGQNRVWMFAGGLFLASVGGVAAAYFLVGPPMANTAYIASGGDDNAAQTSSLEVDGNVATTSSHFQGVPVLAKAPDEPDVKVVSAPNDDIVQASVSEKPAADLDLADADVPSSDGQADTQPVTGNATDAFAEVNEPAAQKQETAAAEPSAMAEQQRQVERMVQIVPTAVSDEVKKRTNVNAAESQGGSGGADGQWVRLPSEDKPAEPAVIEAAASQQSNETKPVDGPAKSQQELFKAFQAYLARTGHRVTGDNEDQEALFDKFMRWSVESPKGN